MYILHIETSTSICSVALSSDHTLIGLEEMTEGMNHAAQLSPMIDRLLKSQSLSTNDLEAVSVSSGPGSYTGLRVGGSTAKAFAYSLEIPLIAIPTLEALAIAVSEKYPEATHFLPMLDARRDEVYAALFDRQLDRVWADSAIRVNHEFLAEDLEGFEKVVFCGDGAFKVLPLLAAFPGYRVAEEIHCSARHLIRPALERLIKEKTEDPLHYTPSYLKLPNITQAKRMV